ncbi:MAG: hypothetical protein EHM83_15695 [Burkholderiales bacterium]|nr:MAG: hypothetical protein EHM83_15695 [Burkholderiales bacterium]
MRTNARLDEHLLAQARQYAAVSGKPLTAVLQDALREALARRNATTRRRPVRRRACPAAPAA